MRDLCFASHLKLALKKKGVSQRELSSLTGIHETAISHFTRGARVPRLNNLVIIAEALEISLDALVAAPSVN
jgi:transcriptional regulator with XRE-family HTH domain